MDGCRSSGFWVTRVSTNVGVSEIRGTLFWGYNKDPTI